MLRLTRHPVRRLGPTSTPSPRWAPTSATAASLDEGFALLEQSWALAQENGDAFARFLAVWRRGFGSVLAHDPDDALLWFEREQAADRAERSPLRLRTMATMVAIARLLRGETRPASRLPADETDNGPLFEPLLALCTLEGDDVERSWRPGRPRPSARAT